MNEFSVNKNYNWQEGSQPLVKKYVADLHQDGSPTPPMATELFNNTGMFATYEYIDPGVYSVILSENVFDNNMGQKCQATITNNTYIDNLGGPNGYSVTVFPVWYNVLIILTSNLNSETDGILGDQQQNALELTIYP